MKKLLFIKKTILTICIVLITTMSWGQTLTPQYPEGENPGSSTNPYIIAEDSDWGILVSDVAAGYPYAGKVIKLTADINVSTMVGDDSNYFSGTFDGDNKTLTFSYTAVDEYDTGIAPFYYLEGATVRNLTIDGSINAKGGMVAGLSYYNYGETINNVTISMDIIADGQYWCGGFAYESSDVTYSNCVYNGKIVAGPQSCGFTVEGDDNVTFTNCLFDPTEGSSITSGEVFGIGGGYSTCYYTDNIGATAQGTKVYNNPTDFIGKKVSAFPDYCTPVNVIITGVNLTYNYDSEINYYGDIMSGITVTSDDPALTYSVSIHDKNGVTETVTDKGDYAVVVTGSGNYIGSYKKDFHVVGDIALQNPELPYNATTNPYVITSTADWIKLSDNVSKGINADKSYKLTADIAVTDMVGTSDHPFSGNFSGREGETNNIHILTFNCGTGSDDATDEQIVAPFRYTDGATIQYLRVSGAIHTNVGKEAGLIGVNTNTTTVQYVIVDMNFYCYDDLWDAEGGGFAYDGKGIHFNSCAYQGTISAENYHGGFCGNADNTTTFTNCMFNPSEGGVYWAENFVWNNSGATFGSSCYYTLGNNQEDSEQGTLVYVVYAEHTLPAEIIAKKLTTLYGRGIYQPVDVVISGVNKRYLYTGSEITITPGVTFDSEDALANNYCSWSISPSPVLAVGLYTFTVTAPKEGVASDYLGSVTQMVRVVESSSAGWTGLQTALSGSATTITLDKDIIAGEEDAALVIESGRTVTINLNGYTIDRGFYNGNDTWNTPVVGGHVLKIAKGATVTIENGTIKGGGNKGASNTEHGENNDGGGIFNMGSLTLNNVTVEGNYCEKYSTTTSRTARGGGIYSGKSSTLIINNSTIRHNEAKGGGGGIYAEQAAIYMMDNTTVQSNRSQDKGGGIRVDATNTKHNVADGKSLAAGALLKDCHINSNTVVLHSDQSASNGGGIHLDAGTLNLTDCTINTNNSSKYGGGIYMMGGTINAKNCSILYNKSYDSSNKFEGYGGGICVLNGTYNMDGGIISGNSSYKEDGGGIFVASGKTLNIKGAVDITGNWTDDDESLTTRHTTNVYLVGSNDKIHITGSIEGSTIGVSKSGTTGRFTDGLNGNGTTTNFISDNHSYQVLPDSGEAKIGAPSPADPPASGTWTINTAEILTSSLDAAVTAIEFGTDGRLYVNTGGVIGNTTTINNTDPNKLIINGGQIILSNSNTDVKATVTKDIQAALVYSQANWYLLSSPLNGISIASNTNLIKLSGNNYPEYDLYRFNEAVALQWENYRADHSSDPDNFTTLTNGRGYLYRNLNDYTINMYGTLNTNSVSYTLTKTEAADDRVEGFNLIGNPYSHDITKGNSSANILNGILLNENYYTLNQEDGTWVLTNDGTAIPPLAGILVQAKNGVSLSITNEVQSGSKGREIINSIWFDLSNNVFEDAACVSFKEGRGLNKMEHLNENAPMLYVNHNGENFASADLGENALAFNLNFKAKTTGMYTLSMKPQGEFSYIHLIDKVAGRDIDLLSEGEYIFIGSPGDGDDRFVVRLSETTTDENGNEIFAYQNGSNIIVNGDGELQVFDVMGRMIASLYVNGVQMVEKPSQTGVYIFRLNDKTQKIVVK